MLLATPKVVAPILAALLAASGIAVDGGSSLRDWIVIGVLVGGITAYVIAQVKDYRPNKQLRRDIAELRDQYDDQQKLLTAAVSRAEDLEATIAELKHSRDFDAALGAVGRDIMQSRADAAHEHKTMLDELRNHNERLRETLDTLATAVQRLADRPIDAP